MKKIKLILIISISFISGVLLTNSVYSSYYSSNVVSNTVTSNLVKTNSIAMMLETDIDSNEYYLSTNTSWPESGYVFNESLSKCEKGATLSWDSNNKQVLMTGNSSDKCYIYFDLISTIDEVCDSGDNLSECIQTLYSETGEATVGLYYLDGVGNYTNSDLEAKDYSYRYSGSDYFISSEYANQYSSIANDLITYTCGGELNDIGTYCSSENEVVFILTPTGETFNSYKSALYAAIDDEYLISGNINNYICLSNEDCKDTNNLYRIIGIFQNDYGDYEVKLIKYDYCTSDMCGEDGDYISTSSTNYSGEWYYTEYKGDLEEYSYYYWNGKNYINSYNDTGYYTDWSYSQLNTVNLNNDFYNNLTTTFNNLIEEHTWIVGGNTSENIYSTNAISAYNYELKSYNTSQVTSTITSNIALVYVSDYYYSAQPIYWSYQGNTYSDASENNWMHLGLTEYTLTRTTDDSMRALAIQQAGDVGRTSVVTSTSHKLVIRPTFYLTSSVEYSSGSGTLDDPIILVTE